MKKLLALLLLMPLLFVACGDEDEPTPPTPPPYFNPVEGEWVYTLAQYNYTETRVFTKEFDALSISVNNGYKDIAEYGKYTINESTIKHLKSGSTYTYTIKGDTLHLKNINTTWQEKYIKKR